MGSRFDEFTKAMAGEIPRREALGRLTAGGLLAAVGLARPARAGNSCAAMCNDTFPPGPSRGRCHNACAKCGGNTDQVCFSAELEAGGEPVCCTGQCCPGEDAFVCR